MIKDTLRHNESVLPNSREMAALREYFPACFKADGHFDAERFEEFLSNKLTVTHDGYELKFRGKNYGRLLASLDTTTVVVPDEAHNAEPENADSENIYISGDNLDGLKHLLKSYSHKVKCIYIDPPYNTGSDGFVYNDSFNFTVEELSDKLSIDDVQAQRILDLTKRGSASHSAWLMFMYPRLLLARDLLTEDGVIFISIDDNEQSNLKLLCDDVFGEENFEGNIHWRRRHNQPNDKTKLIGLVAEHILVYSKNQQFLKEYGVGKIALTGTFSNPDHDPRGDWASKPWKSGSDQSGTRYTIISPTGKALDEEWMGDEETYKSLLADNRIIFPRNGDGMPRKKYFKSEREEEGQCASNWWSCDVYGNNAEANDELTSLFGVKNVFSNPKPTKLINAIIRLANLGNGDFVVDFFSGSATTAHALMQLNEEDKKDRHFILIQSTETVKCGSEAERQGYRTIDQIGIERIKRAAAKIRKEHPDTTADLGFRHYTLAEPSQHTLDELEKFDPNENSFFTSDLLTEFGKPTVLATWLNRDGYGLTAKPEEIDFAGYKGYYIGQHLYLIDKKLTNEAIEAILNKFETDGNFNPKNVVLFGYSFLWTEREALQTNLKQLKDKDTDVNFDIRY